MRVIKYCLAISFCWIIQIYGQSSNTSMNVKIYTLNLIDTSRNRSVPVALYFPTDRSPYQQQIIIFSHGYGENKGGDNAAYSYLTATLASKGYIVASVQHELSTDDLLPMPTHVVNRWHDDESVSRIGGRRRARHPRVAGYYAGAHGHRNPVG